MLLIALALYVWSAKPCKIYSFNIIDFGFYILAAWICIITVITHQTGSELTGYICLVLGLVVITIFTVVYYFISRKAEMGCEQIYKVWRGGERKRFKQQ